MDESLLEGRADAPGGGSQCYRANHRRYGRLDCSCVERPRLKADQRCTSRELPCHRHAFTFAG
jgi:hypothetical protein